VRFGYNLDNKLLKIGKAETRTVWKRNAAGVERVIDGHRGRIKG